jgi:hypothetical protein
MGNLSGKELLSLLHKVMKEEELMCQVASTRVLRMTAMSPAIAPKEPVSLLSGWRISKQLRTIEIDISDIAELGQCIVCDAFKDHRKWLASLGISLLSFLCFR